MGDRHGWAWLLAEGRLTAVNGSGQRATLESSWLQDGTVAAFDLSVESERIAVRRTDGRVAVAIIIRDQDGRPTGLGPALRRASGRLALAADAEELEAVLLDTPRRDVFTDPFEQDAEIGPALLLLDADQVPEPMTETARRLARLADCVGVRVCHISSGMAELGASDVERYVTLLLHGRYAATYLGIGLGPAQG